MSSSKNSRRSGLRSQADILKEEFDFSSFIEPYLEIQQSYREILENKKAKENKAYKVTYETIPNLIFICFTSNKDKAKGLATKYFKENYFVGFTGREWRDQYNQARGIRIPEFDKYNKEKLVPIVELMKIGAKFPCSACGKEIFSLKDYEDKRCFIIEDEGNLNVFTKGFILCYDCYKKYLVDSNK